LTLEDGTDTLSRNVGKGLPFDAAEYPKRAQISSASRRKPEITERILFLSAELPMTTITLCRNLEFHAAHIFTFVSDPWHGSTASVVALSAAQISGAAVIPLRQHAVVKVSDRSLPAVI
jgi:hypothetical protein